jgi:hypothetical protein
MLSTSRPRSDVGTDEAPVSRLTRASSRGVSDGARTRDTQDHNLVLYQLSYTHRVRREHAPGNRSNSTGVGQPSDAAGGCALSAGGASPASSSSANEPTTSAAAACASSLPGPGAGTKSVRR